MRTGVPSARRMFLWQSWLQLSPPQCGCACRCGTIPLGKLSAPLWLHEVQEYGEVHNSQPGINALPPQLCLEIRQIVQRSIEKRAVALVCLELADIFLAVNSAVLALLHDGHSLRGERILSIYMDRPLFLCMQTSSDLS